MAPAKQAPLSPEWMLERLTEDVQRAAMVAQVLKSIGNPTRVRIIAYLCLAEERTVSEISQALGLSQAITSQQLAALRLNGQVHARREGGYRYYALAVPELRHLMGCVARCCQAQHGDRVTPV